MNLQFFSLSSQVEEATTTASLHTLADKVAAYCMAERGYVVCSHPGAAALAKACDILLVRSDLQSISFVCIVDGDRNPGKVFPLTAEETRALADSFAPRKPSGALEKGAVYIHVVEIAPKEPALSRKAHFAPFNLKGFRHIRLLNACLVDSHTGEVWVSAWIERLHWKRFLARAFSGPDLNAADIAQHTEVAAPVSGPPLATFGLAALLIAVFICEIAFGVNPPTAPLTPSAATLLAMGALQRLLVVSDNQWFRMLTAAFLHGGILHLLFNGVALVIGGVVLERLIGKAWFLAIFLLSALGGSALSLVFNSPVQIGVGASGAILGLFGCLLALAWRYPPGVMRSSLLMTALQVLLPTLLTFRNSPDSSSIDIAAHIGGFSAGLIVGLAFLKFWPRNRAKPRLQGLAWMVTAASLALVGLGLGPLSRTYADISAELALAPDNRLKNLSADAQAGGTQMIAEFPDDPRGWIWSGVYKFDHGDPAGAEQALRIALSKRTILDRPAARDFKLAATYALASSVAAQGRRDEAQAIAEPLCAEQSGFQKDAIAGDLCR